MFLRSSSENEPNDNNVQCHRGYDQHTLTTIIKLLVVLTHLAALQLTF